VKVPSIRTPTDGRAASEPRASAPPPRPAGYFRGLWRAEIPLSRVFWLDMIVIGTVVNLAAMGLAFLTVALGASTAAGIAIFLAPVPYNILLVTSVWRRADIERADWAWLARFGSLLWLILAFVV
jgi:hypothetical protein